MKIAIASDDQKLIAGHFGRTRGFLVYDIEDNKVAARNYISNDFTGHAHGHHHDHDHHHGHAHSHASILEALKGCEAVISRGMGRRIYDDLQQAGIQAFIVNEVEADKAVDLFLQQKLEDNPNKGCDH